MMVESDGQRECRRRHGWRRWCSIAGGALALSLAGAASCGGSAGDEVQIESNTNWLQRCGPDAPCPGALMCLCGMCSQPCAEAAECGRLGGATCSASCGEAAPSGGGMCVLGCTTDGDCGADFVCQAAECRPRPVALEQQPLGDDQVGTAGACSNAFVSLDRVFERARLDLEAQPPDAQPFLRYLSLANRNDAGACDSELEVERLALVKLLNSTSTEARITLPVPLDSGRLLYRIDLRDYGWQRPRGFGGTVYSDAWEMLAQNTAYAVAFDGPDARVLSARAATPMPLIQSDAIVHAAASGESYMALLELPRTLDDLLSTLGIDAEANRRNGTAQRLGTTRSRIARGDRIFERHAIDSAPGVLWMTLDYRAPASSTLQAPFATSADGGVVTFSLPNGLPGFAVYDQGRALAIDSDILLDVNQRNFRTSAAVSCMGCHTDTILPIVDEVASDLERYDAAVREEIQRLYPGTDALRDLMASDNARFRSAIEQLGIVPGSTDSVSTSVLRFERDLTASEMAGDLMLSAADLEAMQPLPGIEIASREEFEQRFVAQLCASLASARNRPLQCDAL